MRRQLQSLVIYDPITGKNYTGNNAPSSYLDGINTQQEERPTSVIACRPSTVGSLSSITLIQFYYNVETNASNVTEDTLDNDFPNYINGNMIHAISPDLCEDGEGGSTSSENNVNIVNRTNHTASTLLSSNCVLSISSGPVDQRLMTTTCVPSIASSQSCTVYEGTIQIVYTDACTERRIHDDTLSTLGDTVQDDAFMKEVNRREPYRNGVRITKVALADSIYNESTNTNGTTAAAAEVEYQSARQQPMAGAAIAMIVLLVMIFLVLILIYCIYRRRQHEQWRRHQEEKARRRASRTIGNDDNDDAKTDWSVGKSSQHEDEERWNKPDYYNLGKLHNTVDVHVCRSALCTNCTKFKNIGHVNMVPVRHQDLNNDYCMELKQQPEQQEQRGILKHTSSVEDKEDEPPPDATTILTIRNNGSLIDDDDDENDHSTTDLGQDVEIRNHAKDEEFATSDVTYVRKSRWEWGGSRRNSQLKQQDPEKSLQL
jgi:hypothetical protein